MTQGFKALSDLEVKKFWLQSGYYKKYGKHAGRKAERQGKYKKSRRDSKHLPW